MSNKIAVNLGIFRQIEFLKAKFCVMINGPFYFGFCFFQKKFCEGNWFFELDPLKIFFFGEMLRQNNSASITLSAQLAK